MANKTEYNNYSPELLKQVDERIASLGGTVIFQLNTGKKIPVPGQNPGTWDQKLLYNATYAPPVRDRVKDGKEFKDTGVILQFDGDGNPIFDQTWWIKPEETEGVFMLRDKIDTESRRLRYLLAGNYVENGVNPDRDKSKAICRIIDKSAEGREKMERFTIEQAAFLTAMSMDEPKILEFAAAMGWDEREGMDVLRPQVIQLSKDQPKWFSDFVDGNGIEYRAVLKNAITANLVTYEPTTNEVRWANGETVAQFTKETGKDYLDKWAVWVVSHPEGQKRLDLIKAQLKKKK